MLGVLLLTVEHMHVEFVLTYQPTAKEGKQVDFVLTENTKLVKLSLKEVFKANINRATSAGVPFASPRLSRKRTSSLRR